MTDVRRTGTRPLHRHPQAPPAVRWIVRTLEEEGFETWTVGGAVRDVLLGVPSLDWDLATRATPRQVRRIFRRTVPIGIEHGTVGVLTRDDTMYEVTTFRKDVETDGRHAVVAFADRIEDDLARRDFTVNAVAWHPLRDELYDPFGGVDDLEAGVLRTVGAPADRFAEDHLRVLRALRFAGRYRLTIETGTWRALCAAVPHLPALSPERVREELVKVLEKDDAPSRALSLWAASGALGVVLPEVDALVGTEDTRVDAWTRALLRADGLSRRRPLLRLAALLMDVGVPPDREGVAGEGPAGDARAEGVDGADEADGAGAMARDRGDEETIRGRAGRRTAAIMSRLRWSNAATDRVVGIVRAGVSLPAAGVGDGGAERRRWLARVGPERLPDVARVAATAARVRAALDAPDEEAAGGAGQARPWGSGSPGGPGGPADTARRIRALRGEIAAGVPLSLKELALDGRDLMRLGLKPGPRFGEILERLLERVLADPELNDRDVLRGMVAEEMEAR